MSGDFRICRSYVLFSLIPVMERMEEVGYPASFCLCYQYPPEPQAGRFSLGSQLTLKKKKRSVWLAVKRDFITYMKYLSHVIFVSEKISEKFQLRMSSSPLPCPLPRVMPTGPTVSSSTGDTGGGVPVFSLFSLVANHLL